MDYAFDLLTDLCIDPFAREAERARASDEPRDRGMAAMGGRAARCAFIFDPGPDPGPDPDPPDVSAAP